MATLLNFFNYPKFHAQTSTGAALVGGKLYTYSPGTTTPKASYSDAAMSTPNTNPVILDALGDAVVYLNGTYDVVLKNSADVVQWSMAGVTSVGGSSASVLVAGAVTEILVGGGVGTDPVWTTATGTGAPVRAVAPTFTGVPLAPTAAIDTNTTQLATTAFVKSMLGYALLGNEGIVATVASKALTIALKAGDGTDATTANRIRIAFRSPTLSTGTPLIRDVTAALSLVVPSGATLGFTANEAGRIYIWAIDNAGTVVLAVSKYANLFAEDILASTTALTATSDTATVMYSTDAQSSKACVCLGYIDITTGAVAGEWDIAPTKVQLMVPGIRRTGEIVQIVNTQTGALATGTTLIPFDDSIPQITEGDEYMTLAVIPKSAVNKLLIEVIINLSHSGAGTENTVCLFQDATANALACVTEYKYVAGSPTVMALKYYMTAGTVSSTTFRVRAGSNGAGTMSFNGQTGARTFGGVLNSSITITEIAA